MPYILIFILAPPFPVPGYMAPMPISSGGPPQISPAPPVIDQNILLVPQSTPLDDEPPNKKLRSEDNLVPETEFIAMHKVVFAAKV